MHVTGIDAHYILAKDLKRATDFYRTLLGCEPASTFPTGVEFELPDGTSLGIGFIEDRWYPGGGALFAVENVSAHVEIVRSKGGTVLAEPFETPVCHLSWCMDTEGNNFALHKRKS